MMNVTRGIFVLAARILSLSIAGAAMAQTAPPEISARPATGQAVAKLRSDAAALEGFVGSSLARSFLAGTAGLPEIEPVELWVDRATRRYYTAEQFNSLPEEERAKVEARTLDETFFYNTKYGSPLAYCRALDLIATCGHPAAITDLAGRQVLDFGYGNIGQLQLMNSLRADVVGVDVDPLLVAFYGQHNPELFEAGVLYAEMKDLEAGRLDTRSVRLVNGRWPADPQTVHRVGPAYDLFISKNTLKRGYVHPEREADPRLLIDLGVSDEQYLAKLHEILNPGGWVMIYNLCPAPAPADKPYIPWADGRCPFSEEAIRAAGFEVLVYDRDDTEAARRMAHLLGWDAGEGGMNLKDDLFAWYTLLHKPLAARAAE